MNFGFFTMAALPFALMMNTIVNGVSRPVFGWLSDHIGREQVMFIAFSLEALGILALGWYGSNPWAFVVLSGIVFFAWGEVYSLFSATAGDTFGTKNIGTIYGLLYCAKGVAALLVPFGNLLMEATGTWTSVLYTMAALDLSAALAAILILKPLRRRLAEGDARSRTRPSAPSIASVPIQISAEIVPSAPGMRDRVRRIAPAAFPPRSAI